MHAVSVQRVSCVIKANLESDGNYLGHYIYAIYKHSLCEETVKVRATLTSGH
jgi:hypothetical protein